MPSWRNRRIAVVAVVALAAVFATPPGPASADEPRAAYPVTARANLASNGTQATGPTSYSPFVSPDGRYIVFSSDASNLVPGDTNGVRDVFVRDLTTSTTSRVSVASDGTEANGPSAGGMLSRDGRFVTIWSHATNLVPGDTNGAEDVFVHDRVTAETSRVSLGVGGVQGNADSAGGVVSADGRFVGFGSDATNLVAGDTNGVRDGFVHDRLTSVTARVTVASDGTEANAGTNGAWVSPDGTHASFLSAASNLVTNDENGPGLDVFVHNLTTGETKLAALGHEGQQPRFFTSGGQMSADNRLIVFSTSWPLVADDTNNEIDVFVRDLVAGTTTRVSVADDGSEAHGNISPSSTWLAADGGHVVFHSDASDLVPGDTNGQRDVFVRDLVAGTTTRIEPPGEPADAGLSRPSISDDGGVVAFRSSATNLVPGDTNDLTDVFVAHRTTLGAATGTVTATGTDQPVHPAWVAALDPDTFALQAGTTTGPDGQYQLPVEPGDHYLYVIDPNGFHTTGFHTTTPGGTTPATVTVTAGHTTTADPQPAPTRGTLAGTLTGNGGNPLDDAWIVTLDPNTGAATTGATTAPDGTWTLPAVTPGNHLAAFVDPTGNHQPAFFDNTPSITTATPLTVTPGDTTTADATLTPTTPPTGGAALTGTLTRTGTGDPLADIRVVALTAATYQHAASTTTGPDGTWTLDLDPGGYKITYLDPAGAHHPRWHPDLAYHQLEAAPTITAPADIATTLDPTGATIDGTVTHTTSGQPVPDTWVAAIGPTGPTAGTTTAPDGTYTLTNLPPGTYRLAFVDPHTSRTHHYHPHTANYSDATPIPLVPGQTTTIDTTIG